MNKNKSCVKKRLAALMARAVLALSLSSFFALSAKAVDGTATVTGGEVQYFGAAEVKWLNGTDLLLKYTSEGSFILPGLTKARVLAIGGGGGGAGVCSASGAMVSPFGAGAGGGAGGFVEVTNVFPATTYAVAVGSGGAGGVSASAHAADRYTGTSGGDTTLTTNGVVVLAAKGGGGGGGEAVGLDGGSGGGGSQYRASSTSGQPRAGGSGTVGQGYAGGAGDGALYAGGGGGAGGAGAAASTQNPVGGDGRASDIACNDGEEPVWYAGGGGGGFSDKSFTASHDPIAGGKGGGGAGGYGLNVACTDATFYGGGGGGSGALTARATTPGGSGYQGVVYVRISIVAVDEIVKPTSQTIDFDGAEHVLVPANPAYVITDLTEGSATYGQVVSRMAATAAGTYKAKVTLVDGFEWPGGGEEEVTVTLVINKATPVISDLGIRDWIVGTPTASTPNPRCTVSIAVEPTYEYGESATGPWSAEKPTAVGTHYLRAYIEETESYNAAEAVAAFNVVEGPGDVYRDYVEITVGAASSTVSDFVYELKLAEGAPVGFLYERAGETGEDLTVTDANGARLPYSVETWNTAGESTLYVKLPELATAPQVIRLFWFVRDGKTPPSHESAGNPSGDPQPSYDFDLVVRDGKRVNYWLTYPTIEAPKWDSSEPAPSYTVGTVAEGLSSLLYSTNLNTGAVSPGLPTSGGSFSVVFGPYDPAGDYEPLEYGIDVFVVGHVTYDDLAGDFSGEEDALTRNGRVLLANDDSAPAHAVKGQSYWQTDGTAYSTYWEHSEDHGVSSATFPYIRPYANHTLYAKDSEGNAVTLWTLENVLIGSTYARGPVARDNACYLPNSSTAKAISSETASAGLAEQGTMIMRNIDGKEAAILSPLYTNGVGTVYFDVVNSSTDRATDGSYKIQVEVSVDGGVNYEPYKMKPFKREGTAAFVPDQTDTKELTLAITTGGTADNFYRVAVPVDTSGNVRFKIVRTARVPGNYWAVDENGFILVDNILVSYPKSTASLEPYGEFDKDRVGRQVLGWANSMSEPFPSVGSEVYARAKAIVKTNANAHVAVDLPIAWAQMHYRWRYLEQKTNEWQVVNLRPSAGYASTEPLALPDAAGDVEFWYDYIIQVPAYRYFDYSGLGLGLAGTDGKALYSEDLTSCTNRQADVTGLARLASGGDDWFFRVRRGESVWESFTIYAKESEDGPVKEYPMALAANHIWRGFLPTRRKLDGGLYVRIAAKNAQTAGTTEYDFNTQRYSLGESAGALPATGTLAQSADDDGWTWLTVPCDAKSGQVLLQLQDDTLAYTVVHADYQDFNGWTDAYKNDGKGLFVGTSSDTNSTHMSGTTSDAVTYLSHFESWNETVPTNRYWTETFPATEAELSSGAWPLYQPFDSAISPNTAFSVGPGQWVNGYYRDNKMGMALQMEGKGKGYIQLVDYTQSPRGLESVTFKARVSQAIEFKDFCYFMTDPTALKNYTFMSAAAFDINQRRSFAGNASLSLVALYTPGVGCYELRVEQEDTATVSAAGAVTPSNIFRISLYRWAYDDEMGEVVATQLGTTTHSNSSSMFNTNGENGNYARLFISVDTSTANETRIVCGVARTSVARASFYNSAAYREVAYRDGAENRLTSGTYGLLSANCPARFVQPIYGATTVTFGGGATKPGLNTFNGNNYGNYSLAPIASADRVACQADLNAGRWVIGKSRMEAVNTDNSDTYGINALIPSTTVDVYTAPAGSVKWGKEPLISTTVTGFGSSTSAGDTTTIPIYSLDACSVKIAAGGNFRTGRVDVTIDDLEFRQWRGESYDDEGQSGVFDQTGYGSPTNIVFTQAWVSNRVATGKICLLSAKRSYADTATSIRSPRMVNDRDEGMGLGQVSFTYADAQSNACVLVQVNTNNVALSYLADITKSTSEELWTTVTNVDFSAMSAAERASGTVRVYLGLHGVKGAMRIALDPKTVNAVTNVTDATAFGEVTITGVSFRDEPMLDAYSWWGWNLRTTGESDKISIDDNAGDPLLNGLAFALNNSVTDGIRTDEPAEQYRKKYPLLQSPTFATNLVNEVSFLARLYDPSAEKARVTLYGARSGDLDEETLWTKLASWDVTNTTFEAYTKKFGAGNSYRAFRLAVTGVDGVTEPMGDDDPLEPAQRVLIDEVLVMEGIVATVSFRNVGAFRSGLDLRTAVTNVPSASQQPLCGEEWGVQCEVYASQLADEIDLSHARVRLWWYEDVAPWGFENWKNRSDANKAWLTSASDSNLVFRSGYFGASGAVMQAQPKPKLVQYMLEVVYTADGLPQTNWLSSTEWDVPSWYAPLDANADYGRDGAFAAYTILDTVAPGWAWINEANVFGEYDEDYNNTDKNLQFVEIAAPVDADLSGWTLRFLDAKMGGNPVRLNGVVTNDVAVFGETLPGKKSTGVDAASKFVFHVVGSPNARGVLDASDGRLDGTWSFANSTESAMSDELMSYYPVAVQLVRPSGIVEHEIVTIGTNDWAYVSSYNPDNAVALLNEYERGARFIYAGMDAGGIPAGSAWSRSRGVSAGNGTAEMQWNDVNLMTPGRINGGQVIPEGVPTPRGSALVIYSIIEGGDLTQTFASATDTAETVTLVYKKGSEEGTNITYRTTRWHEMGLVTVNGQAVTPTPTGNQREWTLEVGRATSNDVTVVASAQVDSSLAERYGVPETSRYRDAIVSWLMRGADAYGNAWHDPDATTLGLADKADQNGLVQTNMTLTEMYWFDIDPTWNDHDIRLNAGWKETPAPMSGTYDMRGRMYMQITNTAAGGSGWAPYVLQGCDFENNSWAYADPSADWLWTNATFKIKGLLPVNGITLGNAEERNWVAQRWFVFTPTSFDENYTSSIEMVDPCSTESPGHNAGWYDWAQKYGRPSLMFFRWDVSDGSWPTAAEVLKVENPCRPTEP